MGDKEVRQVGWGQVMGSLEGQEEYFEGLGLGCRCSLQMMPWFSTGKWWIASIHWGRTPALSKKGKVFLGLDHEEWANGG